MERVILVEVLDRRFHVAQRLRLERLPAVIGRAYDCDVVLDDPYADARHARLAEEEGGVLVVEDLGSANGLFEGGRPARVERVRLAPGTVVRVGQTSLRVRAGDEAVAGPLPLPTWASATDRLVESRRARLVAPAAGLAWVAVMGYVDAAGESEPATAIGVVLAAAMFVALWAGGWAIGARIAGRRAQFLAHSTASWLFVIVMLGAGMVQGYGEFLWPGARAAWSGLGTAVGIAAFAALIFAQLGVASGLTRLGRRTWAVGIAVGLQVVALGLVKLGATAQERTGLLPITAAMRPVPAALTPAVSVDRFVAAAAGLQAKVDALADEKE